MTSKLRLLVAALVASSSFPATGLAQTTPDAKAGSVVVETQPPKARVRPEAARAPDPVIVVVPARHAARIDGKPPAKPVAKP